MAGSPLQSTLSDGIGTKEEQAGYELYSSFIKRSRKRLKDELPTRWRLAWRDLEPAERRAWERMAQTGGQVSEKSPSKALSPAMAGAAASGSSVRE